MTRNKAPKTEGQKVNCPHCDQQFEGNRGVGVHISKRHPAENRDKIANSYQPTPIQQTENSEITKDNEPTLKVKSMLLKFEKQLKTVFDADSAPDVNYYSAVIENISTCLTDAIDTLPGPKHPNKKYLEARKRKSTFAPTDKTYSKSSNPHRDSKRDRVRRRAKHNFELLQYLFHYSRKKAVRMLLESSFPSSSCEIPLDTIHEAYTQKWSTPNHSILPEYGPRFTEEAQYKEDSGYEQIISPDEVKTVTLGINNDTSSGLDGVPIRVIKKLECYGVIAQIASTMQKWDLVPSCFRTARTVLIPKSGDQSDIGNWRPISICSVLRRIVERVLDRRIAPFMNLNSNQVGFSSQPGTFLNSSIVNGCLQKAKREKLDCCIVLLDVSKAFEDTGHQHVQHSLAHTLMPSSLRNITISLMKGNESKIQTISGTSKAIKINRGVFQGAPLSPRLFNLSIDHVMRELTEPEVSYNYGFKICDDIPKVSARAFADDVALISESVSGARELTKIAAANFTQVGYSMNFSKCKAINIKKGKLCEEPLLFGDFQIESLQKGETIRYLGVNFEDEIKFDPASTIKQFTKDLQNLVGTPMLYPNQKLKIINQYLWPTLIYPLQTAPLDKLPKKFLIDFDKIIRSSIKEIIGIPADTPDAMLYSPTKYRGLQIIRASWETYLQQYNICQVLLASNDQYIQHVRNLNKEMETCIAELQINTEEIEAQFTARPKAKRTKLMRDHLRKTEYLKWCELPHKGKGVQLFQEDTYCNKIIMNKEGLTTSEWISAIKMSANVYPVRSIPGRSVDGTLCRHCSTRTKPIPETLSHVLGFCPRGALLRNTRHNEVRMLIADHLRKYNPEKSSPWKVYEELHCEAENSGPRRIDIIFFNARTKQGYIFDPTVRFEVSSDQAEEVNQEKKAIYNPCIPYFKTKFGLEHIEVIGLFVGARGTITTFFENFRKDFGLSSILKKEIVIAVIRGSTMIAHHHCFNTNN